jgi:hypothetical protein
MVKFMASTEDREAEFAHRQNRFRTVATEESEQGLLLLESTHRCPGKYVPTSALDDEGTLPT